MTARTRRNLTPEERLERSKLKLSEEAKNLRRLENLIAAKKLREAIDKKSPTAAAIRALKGVIKAKTAFNRELIEAEEKVLAALDSAIETLNTAIRKAVGVDIASTYVTRSPWGQDSEEEETSDPDFEVKEPVDEGGREL